MRTKQDGRKDKRQAIIFWHMCGACGAAGPMASYEEGDVVRIRYPQIGINAPGLVARVASVDDEWGLQLVFADAAVNEPVRWIGWEPFACIKEHPGFYFARIEPERFVEQQQKYRANTTTDDNNHEWGDGDSEGEYITIGKGWLKRPFVLPKKMEKL